MTRKAVYVTTLVAFLAGELYGLLHGKTMLIRLE